MARGRVGLPVQFVAIERRDSVGPTHPKAAGSVFEDLVNRVGGQTILRGEMGYPAVAEAKQSAVARAKPQAAVGVLVDGPDLQLRQRLGSGIGYKRAAMQ